MLKTIILQLPEAKSDANDDNDDPICILYVWYFVVAMPSIDGNWCLRKGYSK